MFNGVTVERPEIDAKPLGTIFFVRKQDVTAVWGL